MAREVLLITQSDYVSCKAHSLLAGLARPEYFWHFFQLNQA